MRPIAFSALFMAVVVLVAIFAVDAGQPQRYPRSCSPPMTYSYHPAPQRIDVAALKAQITRELAQQISAELRTSVVDVDQLKAAIKAELIVEIDARLDGLMTPVCPVPPSADAIAADVLKKVPRPPTVDQVAGEVLKQMPRPPTVDQVASAVAGRLPPVWLRIRDGEELFDQRKPLGQPITLRVEDMLAARAD